MVAAADSSRYASTRRSRNPIDEKRCFCRRGRRLWFSVLGVTDFTAQRSVTSVVDGDVVGVGVVGVGVVGGAGACGEATRVERLAVSRNCRQPVGIFLHEI